MLRPTVRLGLADHAVCAKVEEPNAAWIVITFTRSFHNTDLNMDNLLWMFALGCLIVKYKTEPRMSGFSLLAGEVNPARKFRSSSRDTYHKLRPNSPKLIGCPKFWKSFQIISLWLSSPESTNMHCGPDVAAAHLPPRISQKQLDFLVLPIHFTKCPQGKCFQSIQPILQPIALWPYTNRPITNAASYLVETSVFEHRM